MDGSYPPKKHYIYMITHSYSLSVIKNNMESGRPHSLSHAVKENHAGQHPSEEQNQQEEEVGGGGSEVSCCRLTVLEESYLTQANMDKMRNCNQLHVCFWEGCAHAMVPFCSNKRGWIWWCWWMAAMDRKELQSKPLFDCKLEQEHLGQPETLAVPPTETVYMSNDPPQSWTCQK